jgi:hypothetical protein
MQGGSMVLALVERETRVNFGEARCSLQISGVRTYAIWGMKLMKGDKDKYGKNDMAYMH